MGMLHRSAVVIRPLPPYLNWAKHDDTTDIAERVFEDLRTAPHVYLLPDVEDAESEREVLDDFWPELFQSSPRRPTSPIWSSIHRQADR